MMMCGYWVNMVLRSQGVDFEVLDPSINLAFPTILWDFGIRTPRSKTTTRMYFAELAFLTTKSCLCVCLILLLHHNQPVLMLSGVEK